MGIRFRHFTLCLAAHCIGMLLLASLNYTLAPFSLHLSLSGLYIPFPALTLPFRTGLLCVFLTGLLLDAGLPFPFGTSATFFSISFTSIFLLRSFLRWEQNAHLVFFALVLNAFYSVFLFLFSGGEALAMGVYWVRGLTDVLISSLLLLFVGGWFYDLQRGLIEISGIDLARELRELHFFD